MYFNVLLGLSDTLTFNLKFEWRAHLAVTIYTSLSQVTQNIKAYSRSELWYLCTCLYIMKYLQTIMESKNKEACRNKLQIKQDKNI